MRRHQTSILAVSFLVLAAAFSRLIPHPGNFTPIAAMALFGGAKLKDNKFFAFLIPAVAMLLSDWVIGFHSQMPIVYGCFALTIFMGMWAGKNESALKITTGALCSASTFFLVTNSAAWLELGYPKTLDGLLQSYAAGIPFFKNDLKGTLFYTAVLFGTYAVAEATFFKRASVKQGV